VGVEILRSIPAPHTPKPILLFEVVVSPTFLFESVFKNREKKKKVKKMFSAKLYIGERALLFVMSPHKIHKKLSKKKASPFFGGEMPFFSLTKIFSVGTSRVKKLCESKTTLKNFLFYFSSCVCSLFEIYTPPQKV